MNVATKIFNSKNFWYSLALVLIFSLGVFFSFYKLSESPATWTDEGLIIQTAQNLVGQGKYGFQIAPNTIISPSFITTSYPVTLPISLSFYLFGISLYSARVVMAMFIISLLVLVWLLIKDNKKEWVLFTLSLIATFPPLYGQGKNVLGEVPGLLYLLIATYFLISLDRWGVNKRKLLLFGIFSGLCIVTKPIFLLTVPGFLFAIFYLYRKYKINKINLFLVVVSFVGPFFVWIYFQFLSTDSLLSIIGYYSNPYSINLLSAIILNMKDFLTHAQTLFAGAVFILWTVAMVLSYKKGNIKLLSLYLYTFSFLVYISYFRNPPYYRYFFLAEIASIIFLVPNLFFVFKDNNLYKNLIRLALLTLIIFQFYQLCFSSWVAQTYNNHKTEVMQENISQIKSDIPVFVYQAPETVIFLKHFNYFQYFSGTSVTEFGEVNLNRLENGENLVVLTKSELVAQHPNLFTKYHVIKEFNKYTILLK